MSIWIRQHQYKLPAAVASTYLDDCNVATSTVEHIRESVEITERLDVCTGQNANGKKTAGWANTLAGATALSA
eukprot:7404846-Alexandrium_andersonii.AAC.1